VASNSIPDLRGFLMCVYYPTSKVELSGFTAKHYGSLMDIATLGRYSSLMKKAVRLMEIKSDKGISVSGNKYA